MNATLMETYLRSLNHEVTEVRILRNDAYFRGKFAGTIISGYYTPDHYEKLISDIQPYEADEGTKCIWTTLQAADPALLARAANRLQKNAKVTTEDSNIKAFTVFPIDIDSANPTETSASEAERAASAKLSGEVYKVLTEELDLPVVKADSSNGYHLLIFLSELLPNSEEFAQRFYNVGVVISELYGSDIKNYNPSRCWKLYGTTTRKGDSIAERPHRVSQIWLPERIERVSFQELESKILSMAERIPTQLDPKPQQKPSRSATGGKRLPKLDSRNDLEALARECGAVPNSEWKQKAGYELVRTHCPLCHRDDVGKLTYGSNGECGYSCQTNTCSGKNFQDLYESAGYSKAPPPSVPAQSSETHSASKLEIPLYDDADVDVADVDDEILEFPQGLFFDAFEMYRDAHADRVPMSDAYAFAGLKHVISSILGRKIYIESDPPVFPNFFTGVIGDSADAAKGNALRQARKMLTDCDPNVLTLSALATPEGLINQFVTPEEKEDPDGEIYYFGGFADGMNDTEHIGQILMAMCKKESVRISGFFGEFGSILRKAAKQNAAGLIELLMELYDATPDVKSPTKANPTIAKYPTFSVVAATDKRLIEGVLKDTYISGGFTNRFEWYLGPTVKSRFINSPADTKLWSRCVGVLGKLRNKFGDSATAFSVSGEAQEVGQAFADDFSVYLQSADMADTMVADSLKRTRMHVLKNSLIFAALLNDSDNVRVEETHVEKAMELARFTVECTSRIFENFATTVNKQVEDRILKCLRAKPGQTFSQIANWTRCDVQTLEKAMDALVRGHIVMVEKGQRKNKYSVIRSDAL